MNSEVTIPNKNAVIVSEFLTLVIHNLYQKGVCVETIQTTLNETLHDYLDLSKGVEGLDELLGDVEIVQHSQGSPRSFEEYMEEVAEYMEEVAFGRIVLTA